MHSRWASDPAEVELQLLMCDGDDIPMSPPDRHTLRWRVGKRRIPSLTFYAITMMIGWVIFYHPLDSYSALEWAQNRRWLLKMPFAKFGVGTVCYVSTVMLRSFNELEEYIVWRWVSLGLGIMSVAMMVGSAVILQVTGPKSMKKSK